MALGCLPQVFVVGNKASHAGHAVFHEEGSHFRVHFDDLHDVVFRTDEVAFGQRRHIGSAPAGAEVVILRAAAGGRISQHIVAEGLVAHGVDEFFQGLVAFVIQVVDASLHHDGQGVGRELGKGEEGLLAGVNIPAVRHAHRADRQRCHDGAGEDAGRPGAESQKAQVFQDAVYIVFGKAGNNGAGLRVQRVRAVEFVRRGFHQIFQFRPSVLDVRNEIDFNRKCQIVLGHENSPFEAYID